MSEDGESSGIMKCDETEKRKMIVGKGKEGQKESGIFHDKERS
jgi:hypothetical protein